MKWDNVVIVCFDTEEALAKQSEVLAKRYRIPPAHCFRVDPSKFPESFRPIGPMSLRDIVGPKTKLILAAHGSPEIFHDMNPRELAKRLDLYGVRRCGLITFKACSVGAKDYLEKLRAELAVSRIRAEIGWLKAYRGVMCIGPGGLLSRGGKSIVGFPTDKVGAKMSSRLLTLGSAMSCMVGVIAAVIGVTVANINCILPILAATLAKAGVSSGVITVLQISVAVCSTLVAGVGGGMVSDGVIGSMKLPDRWRTKIIPGNKPTPNLSKGSRYKHSGIIDEESMIESCSNRASIGARSTMEWPNPIPNVRRPKPAAIRNQHYRGEEIELQPLRSHRRIRS
jgi:hypothetical protein